MTRLLESTGSRAKPTSLKMVTLSCSSSTPELVLLPAKMPKRSEEEKHAFFSALHLKTHMCMLFVDWAITPWQPKLALLILQMEIFHPQYCFSKELK